MKTTPRRTSPQWQPLALAAFLGFAAASEAREAVTFDRQTVPAAGSHTVTLQVEAAGRYALRATSQSGVAIRVVDRMSGWSGLAGTAGESDGRLDLFLDAGVVRLVTSGAKLASGEARLTAEPFVERHAGGVLPVLPNLRLVSESLADLESASWWIEVRERRRLTVEAAGRSLADLRLWRDGAWLLADSPSSEVVTPEPQRPLTLLRLSADLEPGLYRLSAYGGAPLPWAKDSGDQPLHLRAGIPRLPAAGRTWRTVSPFGYDRYLAPGKADTLRLELPEAKPASLDVWDWDEAAPFPGVDEATREPIDKDSVPPVARFETAPQDGDRLLEVRADAGQPYVLQQASLMNSPLALGGRSGAYWLSILNTGGPSDSLDPTALLVRRQRDGRSERLGMRAVALSRTLGWARRFNLTGEVNLFLEVQEPADYEIAVSGLSAEARIEPVRLDRTDDKPARMRALPASWTLPAGLYVVTLASSDQGVIAVAIRPRGLRDPLVDWVGAGDPPPGAMPRAAAQFGVVRLAPREATELLASQAGARLGLVLRATPIDIEAALPIAVEPGVELEVPIRASGAGRLTATADDGSRLELQLDGGEWSEAVETTAGEHTARVRSIGAAPRIASLELVPRERLADAPLLAAAGPEGPPPPDLDTSQERFFDIERAANRTFLIAASESGLYRVESTGLLRTAGALRTRVAPSLAAAQENGTGRNFLLATYLREGDYQLAVSTLGDSAGHAGISLRRAALRDRGALVEGLAARSWVGPEEALLYRLGIIRGGHFALAADGLRGAYAVRLEDADGWPVDVTAAGLADVELAPGDYRLLVFPQAVPARAVVRFDRRDDAQPREGHGPHVLPLGDAVSHVWTEPSGDGERTPDRWLFTLPAESTVDVTLDAEMTAEIASASGGETLARVQPGRSLRTTLPAGEFVVAARCSRRNNRVPYTLKVVPVELVAGTAKIVTAPVEIPVAIGRDGFYEIESQGQEDVRARLFDAAGHSVQTSDDRPGDWNFLIARPLVAGRYTLRVDAAAGGTGVTAVALRERPEIAAPAFAVPGQRQLTAGADQLLVPLELPARADFLAATAQTSDGLGLDLEHDAGGGWSVVSHDEGSATRVAVSLPSSDRGRYRLRVRALDRRPLEVALAAWAGAAPRISERALRSGATLRPLPGLVPALAVASVEIANPGCFEVLSAPDGLEQSIAAGEPLRPAPASLVASGRTLWLAAPATGTAAVSARRVKLGGASTRASLTLAAATPLVCDVEASSGPRWVRVSTLGGAEPLAAFGAEPLPAATAIGAHEALALDLGGPATEARLWVASPESPEARVEFQAFAAVEKESLTWGAREIDLSPGIAHRYALPAGAKSARLSLSAGAAALWLAGDRSLGALWASRDAAEERRDTGADGLLLVPTATAAARARIQVLPLDAALAGQRTADGTLLLGAGARYEARFNEDGLERLEIAPGSNGRVRVRGARRATLLGADGSLAHGTDFDSPAAGGTLLVEHAAGLVAAWLEAAGAAAPSSWGFAEGVATPLAPPVAVTLSGRQVEYRIAAAEPRLLHVRPTSGLAAAVMSAGAARFDALAQPRPFLAYLPAGESRLMLRGLAGEALDGGAEISAEPLTPLGEGLGEIVLLPAGGARGYRLHLDGARRVGVGVQADAAGVEVAVFDARGEPLGQAVAQWLDLEAGDYALAILAPNAGGPVTARPAVVGLVPPGDGPPPDVVTELLARLRGTETVAGGTVFQPAPLAALLGEDDTAGDDGSRDESWSDDSTDESDAYDESEDVEGDGE